MQARMRISTARKGTPGGSQKATSINRQILEKVTRRRVVHTVAMPAHIPRQVRQSNLMLTVRGSMEKLDGEGPVMQRATQVARTAGRIGKCPI
mmetsp:Transcript_84295/g.154567  ORF Transcript_84295/g.154567 Transcript_84295/m.154567 type:complete len:93 (+) Transcript_84295:1153-1431(+)